MNTDKENIRWKEKSKIPVPIEPLPPIPQNLIKRQDTKVERQPLKTVNEQPNEVANFDATSSKTEKEDKVKTKTKCPVNIDTRYVTVRQNTEELEDFKVFKDNTVRKNSVIVISNDEDDSSTFNERYFVKNQNNNFLWETERVIASSFKSLSLELNKVKNNQRSLKIPHSRELQGIDLAAPVVKHEKGDERHKRRLFNERVKDKLQSPDFLNKSYTSCFNQEYAGDLFTYLLNMENIKIPPNISNGTRACVTNWLMKINGSDGNPTVIQTALWYLDSILGVSNVQLKKLQLVAAACYWIAQKIHGHVLTANGLVKCSNHAFTAEKLQEAEKAVLKKLKFPPQPVLPQEFITYFAWWCDSSHPGEIEVAATFLCISGLMVHKVLCKEYPSVIGAAAVRNAILLLRKKEAIRNLQKNPVFKEAQKKTQNISYICSLQRKAVRLISSPAYEYKAPLECYGAPPYYIAQRIIRSANELTQSTDTKIKPTALE